jgi:hypothetical protein
MSEGESGGALPVLLKPPDWPFLRGDHEGMFGAVFMSNADGQVNQEVAARLRNEQGLAEYTAWNFHAECWFADGWFCAAVYTHHVHRATFTARTPEQLMRDVSDAYGWD